ncbi:MAG: hypothetical protein KDN05_01185 [Verrucomicrobiae bacterium]|nr:hypothetical protein [Verrucomicrobiae bacterium]
MNLSSTRSSQRSFSPDPRFLPWLGLLAIIALVVLCAWPGMHAPLFSDDYPQLDRNEDFHHWTDVFQPDAFRFYRPVKNALFMAAAPFQKDLFNWHMFGLAAFLLATIGVHRIATIIFGKGRAAWFATAIWALSPSCMSTALWLSCANISLGVAFAALVFHFHERAASGNRWQWLIPALISQACALLCYESLIAVPGLLFLRDLQQRRAGIDRRTVVRYGLYTLATIAFLAVRHLYSAKQINAGNFHSGFDPDLTRWQLMVSAPWFLWRHFLMWVFPFGKLEVLGSYGWMKSTSPAALAFAWLFLGAMISAGLLLWKRLPAVSYGILFFLVASFPAGNFLPAFNGPIHDVYLTIPSIGLAIAVACAADALLSQWSRRRRQSDAGATAAAFLLLLLLAYRIPVCGAYSRYWAQAWSEPIRMMLLVSESRPFQFKVKGVVSCMLFNEGYVEQAEAIARETLAEAPWCSQARLALGHVLTEKGDDAAAEKHLQVIIREGDQQSDLMMPALANLAQIAAKDPKRRDEAAGICRGLLTEAPTRQPAALIVLLATIYQDDGNLPKARSTLEKGLKLHPGDRSMTEMLAKLEAGPTASLSEAPATPASR